MNELSLIVSTEIQPEIRLHPDILNVLFSHRNELSKKFSDIKGTFLIDHFSITIINPENNLLIFSMTPSVEYNLLISELWKFDHGLLRSNHTSSKISLWETGYQKEYANQIKSVKQTKHGFSFGFNLYQNIDSFQIAYSFATRSQNNNLDTYYQEYINELFSLGEYGYKSIRDIYDASYVLVGFKLPQLNNSKALKPTIPPYLKLVCNNEAMNNES